MPGQKNYFPVDGAQFPGCQFLVGSFVVNGASAPAEASIVPRRNAKFTIGAPTTGSYTVTLSEGVAPLAVAVFAVLMDAASNSTKRAFVSNWLNITTTATFSIQTQSAIGTDANLSSSEVVSFLVVLSSSSLPGS